MFLLKQCFPARGSFATRGYFAMSGDTFSCQNSGGAGLQWVFLWLEARDAAECPNNEQNSPQQQPTQAKCQCCQV